MQWAIDTVAGPYKGTSVLDYSMALAGMKKSWTKRGTDYLGLRTEACESLMYIFAKLLSDGDFVENQMFFENGIL
jgi:hypothetical protein